MDEIRDTEMEVGIDYGGVPKPRGHFINERVNLCGD